MLNGIENKFQRLSNNLTNRKISIMETLMYPKETKARKDHCCDFCGYKILHKEKYIKSTYVDDIVFDWKTHKYCDKLSHTLNMYEDAYEGVSMNDFQEIVSDHYLHLLTVKMKDVDNKNIDDILRELSHVRFRNKMWFVIRYFNDLEKINKPKE